MDNWSKRTSPELSAASLINKLNSKFKNFPGAKVYAYDMPPIRGLGTGGGFEFVLQDKTGSNPKRMSEVLNNFLNKAQQCPEIGVLTSPYRSNVAQLYVDIDRDKAKLHDLSLNEVFNTLQTYLGSLYVNDFNKFGKVYQVMLQAGEKYRDTVSDINNIYIKNKVGKLVPMDTIATVEKIFGPEVVYHYNMLNAAIINGIPAEGYSTGQVIETMEKVAKETLPTGMTYSWTGTAYQELEAKRKGCNDLHTGPDLYLFVSSCSV